MDSRVEKSASRTRSEVGRVSRPPGTAMRRLPREPLIIRVTPQPYGVTPPISVSPLVEELGPFVVDKSRHGRGQRRMAGQVGVAVKQLNRLLAGVGDQVGIAQ
jgi:hypothetical protein